MKPFFKSIFRTSLCLFLCYYSATYAKTAIYDTKYEKPKDSLYRLIGHEYSTTRLSEFVNVFSGAKNSVARISKELEGLKVIKLPLSDGIVKAGSIKFNVKNSCYLLIGIFRDSAAKTNTSSLERIDYGKGRLTKEPLIKNAMSITGLPDIDIYAIAYKSGTHSLKWTDNLFMILGAVQSLKDIKHRDGGCPDGRLWDPFIIEGFTAKKALFEVVEGPEQPVLDVGMEGAQDIQGGFEGGVCVKINGVYHMFPTERAGEKGMDYTYDRVKTRIGHWTSKDAVKWKRKSTVFQASGTYAITHDDNPLNDRRGAIWSYMPVFNDKTDTWYGYYLTYTVDKDIAPNHSFGRIWRTESQTKGIEGIGGPYNEGVVIMEPGLDTQLWEGRQGVDSFFPFQINNKEWLAFYGGAYPYQSFKDYPDKPGKGWFIGLAKSKSPEGPWTRMDTTINPIKTIHPWFIENPIVYKLSADCYITIFDGGPLSRDGYNWTEATYIPIETKVNKWWDIMRTPMCLIDEGNDMFTIVYAAINHNKRFHPIGKVKVKLNREVLKNRTDLIKH
ncbi:hypothetical protein [Pedobacter nyackensis]|uniref:Glycosyl hydrolases family 43 n=1 Tax=Pedobacter nyackensis TaxID=475255 RepID=A0A1W2CPU6_9SPHI|nr:hypothetical protein [Pedobacter nyackensis]SMC87233.1 hypothetical protein SAMN04488101_104146 [Pedobacter nyackensis]